MITYFRDSAMPDSPDCKLGSHIVPHPHPPPALNMSSSRPLSASSSISGMNGSHSPLSVLNGRTPSPPSMGSMMGSGMGQQLPPACGARQLSKLKRFLTTLQQFGSDISPEIGDRVRTLVLGLVNSHLSIEEFHAKLQEATNFPLRPFVIPFLKANLPLLQRELMHCARLAKQTPQQFLTQNEHVVFDPAHSPLDHHGDSPNSDLNENGKRRSPESRSKENGSADSHLSDSLHPAKRHHPSGSPLAARISPNGSLNLGSGAPIRLEDISLSREMRERERAERERAERERADRDRERDRHYAGGYGYSRSDSFDPVDRLDDDWRHVETMLNCIVGMVDKTKRALAVLQERSLRDREEVDAWIRRQAEGVEQDVKKHAAHDVMAAFQVSRHHHDDRISEIRRRAEEAVNEVKRQAVLELQKAVAAAESKASEMVMSERIKMDRVLQQARSQARDELLGSVNHQEETSESCWNCGRKASETCSGCNVARYCGSFCQHKDWESHHLVCGKATVATIAQARDQRRAGLAAIPSSVSVASSSTPSSAAAASTSASGAPASSSIKDRASTTTTTTSSTITSPPEAAVSTSSATSGDTPLTSSSCDVKASSSSSVKIETEREVAKADPSR